VRRGDRSTLLADKEVFIYERRAGDEAREVALNFSEQPQRRRIRRRANRTRTAGLFPLPFRERARVRGGKVSSPDG